MKRNVLILFVIIFLATAAIIIAIAVHKKDCNNSENACYWNSVIEGKIGWRKNP